MNPVATTPVASRVERLLRSLVGVSDLHLVWRTEKVLSAAHILGDGAAQQHQLVRNIISGLHAGFGIKLEPANVHVHDDAAAFAAVPRQAPVPAAVPVAPSSAPSIAQPVSDAASCDVVPPATPAVHAPVASETPRVLSVRPSAARTQVSEAGRDTGRVEPEVRRAIVQGAAPRVTLDKIDVERHGVSLRCKVVLGYGDRTFAAIAEVPDSPAAEAELAARVTLDALRAGSLSSGALEGVGFLTIADENYVTVAIRDGAHVAPRVSGAPMLDSMAWAAATAVLHAVGPVNENDSPLPARVPVRAR